MIVMGDLVNDIDSVALVAPCDRELFDVQFRRAAVLVLAWGDM
jgi:hypothetical protein